MTTKAQGKVDNAFHDINKLLARLERLADKYAALDAQQREPDECFDAADVRTRASIYNATSLQLRAALGPFATKG